MTVTPSYSTDWTTTVEWSSKEGEYKIYDTLLAVILCLCTVVGLPGNLLSFFYFYSACRRDFSSFIYTIVSAIDICTCVVHFPVMMALFNARKPGIFGSMTFCVTWIIAFNYVQLMSMFLVMLLSVSRTITLIFLRYKIKEKFLLAAFLAYTSFLMGWHIIGHIFGGPDKWYGYQQVFAYCFKHLPSPPLSYLDQLLRAAFISIPPIISTISFIMVSYKLLGKTQVSRKNNRKHQAVVTMAMFTALFLACNFPFLLNNIMYFYAVLLDNFPGSIYSPSFMHYYSWVITDVVCTVLNAALNPVLYIYRMNHFREWVATKFCRKTRR